ncbi:MAG: glycine oxidase ThiO [Piscirickettsiaceae bacterium]|nr:MAG: glycine oxidase ThiO [Piscirickettsiaceae bacterium]
MFDFVIIGGGIIGLLTAKELQKTGASVAIIEKTSPGQQATWAAGGILSPMRPWHYTEAVNSISSLSQSVYQQLSDDLHQCTGIDPEWVLSGMLVLQDSETNQAIQWCKTHKSPYQLLPVKELKKQFPHLKPLEEPALFRPDVATIRPHRLIKALNIFLAQNGVIFYNDQAAQQLLTNNDQVNGIQLGDKKITASEYIVCGGAWSPQLFPANTPKPDISPVKGQMICFPPINIPNPCMVMDGNRYIIPRKDGRIVVGSTREKTGFNAHTTEQAFKELRDFAQQLYPELSSIEPDAHWAGLRPSSPNSTPYICRVNSYSNLSINAGHYRNGIVTAPASAELMVSILLNKANKIDPTPYQIDR